MVSLLLCCCVGWFSYVRFLPRIAILLESADIWRVEASSEKNSIREFYVHGSVHHESNICTQGTYRLMTTP
jgi:hypothetical protein